MTVDRGLAARLEASEAAGAVAYAGRVAAARPDCGAGTLAVGGGWAICTGDGAPVNHAIGLGLRAAAGAADLRRVGAFFASRGRGTEIELCPLADPDLLAAVSAHGHRLLRFRNIYVRAPGAGAAAPPVATGLRVEEAPAEQAAAWTELAAAGFAGGPPPSPRLLWLCGGGWMAGRVRRFIAWRGRDAAGAGALAIDDGVAWLFSASTLAPFRGAGVQAALIAARMAAAAAAGCELAAVQADPGTPSDRNVRRAGFRLAYTRPRLALVEEPGRTVANI